MNVGRPKRQAVADLQNKTGTLVVTRESVCPSVHPPSPYSTCDSLLSWGRKRH